MPASSPRIIVIAASAGGVSALTTLVGGLPSQLPAPVFIVLHTTPDSPSLLPMLLTQAGPLPAEHAWDGQPIEPGRIYVAPPDRHLLVSRDIMHVRYGPRENRSRPAADPLFRSAAAAYGPCAIGVVLTGNLNDGSAGLLSIKAHGGVAIVQDPAEAPFPSMPASARRAVPVDYCVPLQAMPALLVELASRSPKPARAVPDEANAIEVGIAAATLSGSEVLEKIAVPSGYACPECHGSLWQMRDERVLRYRCRVGHAFTAETLFAEQTQGIEDVLWSAARALQERAALAQRMAERVEASRLEGIGERFREKQRRAEREAQILLEFLERRLEGVDEDDELKDGYS